MMEYFDIILAFFSLFLLWYSLRTKNGYPINWPFVGMLPGFIRNFDRINGYMAEMLEMSGLTCTLKGPWFTPTDTLLTADPRNVQHVTSKNFNNYVKGSKFNSEICDFLGETIVNTDSSKWLYLRSFYQYVVRDPNFQQFYFNKVVEKVDRGLIPVLNHISNQGLELDLQDLFARFSFDVSCSMFLDNDPKSLSVDLSNVPSLKAFDDIAEGIFRRVITPEFIWKLHRWVGIGQEKKLSDACGEIDKFLYAALATKSNDVNKKWCDSKEANNMNTNSMLAFLMDYQKENSSSCWGYNNKFIRDTFLSMLIAGRDTVTTSLSWLFYLLLKNPHTLRKLKNDINSIEIDTDVKDNKSEQLTQWSKFKELERKLVYLHAALCESLRLYPPIPFEIKRAVESDILPSKHHVSPNMPIIFSIYSMARMPAIWGNDCCEFKPERWITESGNIKNVPSYKFFSFMSGPRACLGKSMAITQIKVVAIVILKNYHIQQVEDQPIVPCTSMVLKMKHGFKAKVMRSM